MGAPTSFQTALAPMQDITTHGFMRLIARYGAPDFFVTEFLRVHATSRLDGGVLECVNHNAADCPIFAQIIGEDIAAMVRTARELAALPFAGVDLNLGCPAPKVFRKNVGGGLLRDLPRVDALLAALREALPETKLTVKTRTGFDETRDPPALFEALLEIVNRRGVDRLVVHGRTVRGLYRSAVDYAAIARAARLAKCPVLANGDITSAAKAARVVGQTGCAGVMCGRHAVRNPWLFRQIRETLAGKTPFRPTLGDARRYIGDLSEMLREGGAGVTSQRLAARMKKFLNFIGTGVDPEGKFLSQARRAEDMDALTRVCDAHLTANGAAEKPFAEEPYAGITARPNCEE
jgi:tRNA-dihydrouridine synthase